MLCCIIISCTKNIHSKNGSFSRIKYLVLKSLLVVLRSNDSIFYNSLTPLLENTQMECNCVGDDWMNGIAKLFHVAPHSQPKGAATTTNPISSKSSIPIEPPQTCGEGTCQCLIILGSCTNSRHWSLIIQMSCCMTIQQVRMVATIFYM